MFLQGNIMFAIGPFIGWIRDATQSYEITFHCLTLAMALCAVPWIIEGCWRKIFPQKEEVAVVLRTNAGNGRNKS